MTLMVHETAEDTVRGRTGRPLNSFSSASKSSQTVRMISSQRVSISSSNTPKRRYFVTKTKCTYIAEKTWPPRQ